MQRSSEDHYGVDVKNSIEQSETSSISEPHHKKLTEKTVIFIQVINMNITLILPVFVFCFI